MRVECSICKGNFEPKYVRLEKRCLACRFLKEIKYPEDLSPLGDIPFCDYRDDKKEWYFNSLRDDNPPTQDDILMHDELSSVIDSFLKQPRDALDPRNEYEYDYEYMIIKIEREQAVVRMRFGLLEDRSDRTLEEIGNTFNITRERVRQIVYDAIKKLKHPRFRRSLKNYVEI